MHFRQFSILAFIALSVQAIYTSPAHSSIASISYSKIEQTLMLSTEVKPWYKTRPDGKPGREVMLYFKHSLKSKATIAVNWNNQIERTAINPSQALDSLAILLPANAGVEYTTVDITLSAKKEKYTAHVKVPAKKHWTVYIYPHSHVDIGYTNLQEVVEKLHVRNIDVGIDIAKKTQNYPEGARFVWNPEATWVVSSYLKTATDAQKKSFVEAVRKGWIQIDGAHSNMNTSTCSDEELLRMFKNNHEIASLTGVPITAMVQMDNPGASWGLVQAAAKNGINAFISYPNYYDLRQRWENKPFYWVSQDGKSRIFYLQAVSYGLGWRIKGRKYGLGKIQAFTDKYDRLSTDNPLQDFIDPFIFDETEKLEKQNSPFDIFAMTWSMADNCLIDADLPEAVKLWNEKYAYPKLIIAGTKYIVDAYEKKYKSIIPEVKGDFTEFWTQGLGSDAKRVGMARRGKENLVQAETLWPMINKEKAVPIDSFNQSWENLLLASEHTWGYQDPKAPLAKKVEANKAAFFENAESISKELISAGVASIKKEGSSGIAVINTLSWPRSGLVTLTAEQSRKGDIVLNDRGEKLLSQRLSTGELIFQSDEIPALGSKLYKIIPGKVQDKGKMTAANSGLKNGLLSLRINEKTGNISSLVDLRSNREYVKKSPGSELNSYNYLAGVMRGRKTDTIGEVSHATDVSINVKENGPLMSSFLVTSKAESCNWLTREIRMVKGQPYVELINTVDKISTQKKEGIHYGFAFNIPDGNIKMDIPFGVMVPDKDQISHANKNWFAFQRWIDISNKDYGVTWTAIETPIVELGEITGIILDGARQTWVWKRDVPQTQTLYSWPINNHWETNFPLEQGGIISSTYRILPHSGSYDPVVANRFGVEQHRPLIVVEAERNPVQKPLVAIDNPRVMISTMKKSDDNKAIILRIRSLSDNPERIKLTWPSGVPKAVYRCGADEKPLEKISAEITSLPHAISNLRIEF